VADIPNRSDDETTWDSVVDESEHPSAGRDDTDPSPADALADAGDADAMVIENEPDLSPPGEEIIPTVLEYYEDYEDGYAPTPEESFVRNHFFDLSYWEDTNVVERYWVNEPFAYVSIRYDEQEDDYGYHVVEPVLSEFEQYVRQDISEDLRDLLLHVDASSENREDLLDGELRKLADRYTRRAEPGSLRKIRYYIRRDILGYDRIDPLLHDRQLEDISCDGNGVPICVYHRDYRDLESNVSFPEEALTSFVIRMAQRAGRHISVSNPMLDGSLPNGSRVQLTLGKEVSTRGSNFTIRQFSDEPITPTDLIRWGSFSVEAMTYFWLAIENNLSLIFAGGTASGKTTAMNAVSMFIPARSKVISIEDTREISLPHDNWIQSVTREGFLAGSDTADIDMYQLLQAALRQRPEYLLVGEIRTESDVAHAFFQAMATGHTAYTTMHADSTETVLSRLGNQPLNVPQQMIQELDIVAIQRQVFMGDKRVRRNIRISELEKRTEGGVGARDIYRWNSAEDRIEQQDESRNLADIMYMQGWDRQRLTTELERRERLLRTLVAEDVTHYEPFTTVIRRYGNDPEGVMELVDAGEIDQLL